jgi:6-phosphogluconate dehydrogenase
MEWIRKLPPEERKRLNKLYREGMISRKQFMQKMKNGFFDHERLAVKEKFIKLIRMRDLEEEPEF